MRTLSTFTLVLLVSGLLLTGNLGCPAPDEEGGDDDAADDDDADDDVGDDDVGDDDVGDDDSGDDCDGTTDEPEAVDAPTWFHDGDGDGWGDVTDSHVQCSQPADHVLDNTDYDATMDWPGYAGNTVVQVGRATNFEPSVIVTTPADSHTMLSTDAVVFSGTSNDTSDLDQLYVVISSDSDASVLLTTFADAAGNWAVAAPGGTFGVGLQTVEVTVYDAGALGDATSIQST